MTPDTLHLLPPNSVHLTGTIHERILLQSAVAFDDKTLAAMADVFRARANGFATGEFWGKAVRALCHTYQYNPDPRLKNLIEQTAADLLSTQTEDGCISGFAYPDQPKNSDLWERKYAMLGLLGCYEITGDLKILDALTRIADYTLSQVGPPPKTRIVDTGWAFEGMESSSILEPMMRLHSLTGHQRYLDFARYIVETEGACKRSSIFQTALDGRDVADFGSNGNHEQSIAKAYESQSCFEGLIEYYRTTSDPRWRQAALNFYKNVLAKETAIIGSSCGLGGVNNGIAPAEQWNHTALYQTCPVREGLEGCQAARWMGFCRQLLRLTGNSTIVDAFERSLYNALLGSIKDDGSHVDYYTHLNGARPGGIGYQSPFNGRQITCCYYNVMDSLALIPSVAVMTHAEGPVINLYIPGAATVKLSDDNEVTLEQRTDYPRAGQITITVRPAKLAAFTLRLRIPAWSTATSVTLNGQSILATPGTYLALNRTWSPGDKISLTLDLRCRLVCSPEGSPASADNFRALVRGPIVLVRDKRLDQNLLDPVNIQTDPAGFVPLTPQTPTIPALMQFTVPTTSAKFFPVIDFASAGTTWDESSHYITWIKTDPAA